MNPVRSAKRYYAAAFFLGVVIAVLIASPVRSAEIDHRTLSVGTACDFDCAEGVGPDRENHFSINLPGAL